MQYFNQLPDSAWYEKPKTALWGGHRSVEEVSFPEKEHSSP
jgi:hypothetical protein